MSVMSYHDPLITAMIITRWCVCVLQGGVGLCIGCEWLNEVFGCLIWYSFYLRRNYVASLYAVQGRVQQLTGRIGWTTGTTCVRQVSCWRTFILISK